MGQLIIFEGLDGSGKGTQTKLTAQRLKEQGRDLRQITFPDYDSESSALVKMYLSGAFGDKPDDVNAYAASSFYAVDRFASYKTDWGEFYREGGLVLSDRYTTSNAVHQCSKLPPMHWDGFLNWLFDFEYKKFGLPARHIHALFQRCGIGLIQSLRVAAPASTRNGQQTQRHADKPYGHTITTTVHIYQCLST